MKRINGKWIAGAAIAGGIALTQAHAADVSGSFTRATNASPAQGTLCRAASTAGRIVHMDSNLNTLGANVNIRPPIAGCTRRDGSHLSRLATLCFNGNFRSESRNGTVFTDADLLHDCFPAGGGRQSSFLVHVN
jgi:hypothetical protein